MATAARLKEHHSTEQFPYKCWNGMCGASHSLGASIKHEGESLDESAFLLTISWLDNQ